MIEIGTKVRHKVYNWTDTVLEIKYHSTHTSLRLKDQELFWNSDYFEIVPKIEILVPRTARVYWDESNEQFNILEHLTVLENGVKVNLIRTYSKNAFAGHEMTYLGEL